MQNINALNLEQPALKDNHLIHTHVTTQDKVNALMDGTAEGRQQAGVKAADLQRGELLKEQWERLASSNSRGSVPKQEDADTDAPQE